MRFLRRHKTEQSLSITYCKESMTEKDWAVQQNEEALEALEHELTKAQMILGFVLQETGDVIVPLGKSLPENSAIEVVENDDNTLTVKLVTA